MYAEDRLTTTKQQNILKEYLDSQKPHHHDTDFLSNLMQAWSYAESASPKPENLLSAIPSILALLYKALSSMIDFQEYGHLLGKTLLGQSQLKLVKSGLKADKHKEHLISPCLRLLTETVSFNGGQLASRLFLAKSITLDSHDLCRNLSLWRLASGEDETVRKQTVRSNTLKYVLANLRLQSSVAKVDLLNNGNVMRVLFNFVHGDMPEILQEVFATFKDNVLLDANIPSSNKRYVFNDHNLSSLAKVYGHSRQYEDLAPEKHPPALVQDFLLFVCTSTSAGILRTGTGFYPRLIPSEDDYDVDFRTDLGLDSVRWYGKYTTNVPVSNRPLASFVQDLRPYSSLKESDLITNIFKAAPELIAHYFFGKSDFSFDPKATATWMGYSAFLFNTVQLPVPRYFGRKGRYDPVPPPDSIVIESILPSPLNQKVLTRCLNQSDDLVRFFALRILVAAFEKLSKCLLMYTNAAKRQGSLWDEGASRLVRAFSLRCPPMSDVISMFWKTPRNKDLEKEASLRLLRLYCEVTPNLAHEKFDVSTPLNQALGNVSTLTSTDPQSKASDQHGDKSEQTGKQSLQHLQLTHMLQIARHNLAESRWWHTPESLQYSPFVSLVRIIAFNEFDEFSVQLLELLESIASTQDMFQNRTSKSGLRTFISSLTPLPDWRPSEVVFQWLNDVFLRLVKRPMKYLDDLDELTRNKRDGQAVSLLWIVLKEQWPFISSRSGGVAVAKWLSWYYVLSALNGEDERVLNSVCESICQYSTSNEQRKVLVGERNRDRNQRLHLVEELKSREQQMDYQLEKQSLEFAEQPQTITEQERPDFAETFAPPVDYPKTPLHRILTSDIPTATLSGDLSSVIMLLSLPNTSSQGSDGISESSSLRTQAHINLKRFHARLSETSPESKDYPASLQVDRLLGILLNTTDKMNRHTSTSVRAQPLPTSITAFAAMAVHVLEDPLHPLFPKLNAFLARDPPTWHYSPGRIPSHFLKHILRGLQDDDQRPSQQYSTSAPWILAEPLPLTGPRPRINTTPHKQNTHFLLSYLYHSLCSPAEAELFRHKNVWEPILALVSGHSARGASWNREIVLKILWRASAVEGCATTLITRAGIIGLLEMLLLRAPTSRSGKGPNSWTSITVSSRAGIRRLVSRLWDQCDRDRVRTWSRGGMERIVARIVGGAPGVVEESERNGVEGQKHRSKIEGEHLFDRGRRSRREEVPETEEEEGSDGEGRGTAKVAVNGYDGHSDFEGDESGGGGE